MIYGRSVTDKGLTRVGAGDAHASRKEPPDWIGGNTHHIFIVLRLGKDKRKDLIFELLFGSRAKWT